MDKDFIDIHTHSHRTHGRHLINYFAQELPENFLPESWCSIGLHPWHIEKTDPDKAFSALERNALHTKVLAIGECGLDKNISTPMKLQEEIFIQHLELAEKVNKPVMIHCVKAYSEMLHIRKAHKWKQPWLFHWFNASREIADDLIHFGCYLSFGRSLLNPDGKNAKVFLQVPFDKIFLETDDSGISIEDMYRMASNLKKISMDELMERLNENFQAVFSNQVFS